MRILPRDLVSRLVLAFLLPSLVILALLASLAYLRATAALRTSVFQRLEAIATIKESALDDWVDHQFHDLVLFAMLPELAELASQAVSEATPPARQQAAHKRLAEMLSLVLEQGSSFTEIFLLSPVGGRIVVSTKKDNEGQFRIYDRYYTQGKRKPFVQNVYPSPVTLRPALTLSAPVHGADGELVGVLAAHLALDYLDRHILQRTGLGETGVVTLVDRHKVLVTGESYGEVVLGAVEASVAIEDVIRGRSGAGLYRDFRGAAVIGVYRWLEDRELGLVVEIHQHEAFSSARGLALSILLVGSLSLALLVTGISLVARRIARPILAITDAAAGVHHGDLNVQAPVSTDDEIGALARTFNRMVEQLARDSEERRRAEEIREALISELEAKNTELERFTYTASHDLKSPLLTIRGFLGFLKRDLECGDLERARADAERIDGAARNMERLLNELLELARVGQVVNPPEEIAFGELAQSVADAVAQREEGRGAQIAIAPELPVIFGDRARLQEVLENLVENALKFMGGQSEPRIEIASRSEDGDTVLYVRDNGRGIEPQYHEKVFGLFERLDLSVDGTGIGLAIVRRIVEVHGGRIWVESQGEGMGSTFCFTLPQARSVEQ